MEDNKIAVVQPQQNDISRNMLASKDSFELIQRAAKMFCQSDLVPDRYKGEAKIGSCIIAMDIANRMGLSPLMVMQHLNVIKGIPSWGSSFLIATLNACGKFSPLRFEEDKEDGGRTRAWALDLNNNKEKLYGIWVSMKMAKDEGWIDKTGSKWKTMPELMRRYRAASFFTKQFAPEISMGFQSTEEVQDVVIVDNNVASDVLVDESTLSELPVLQKMDGDKNFTDHWSSVTKAISDGTITSIDDVKSNFTVTPELEKEIIELIKNKK